MQAIRFVLDGQIHTVNAPRTTTTVLDYVREQLHRTGTKEGCAEGDCGACVVMMGELKGERIEYKPVNSCMQLVATLDGKSLKTVESLKRADGTLHPVQQAMVQCHGSQCGFCTPGFVMSMAALCQQHPEPKAITRGEINDAISGNLCRCTGYRPIVDAAFEACRTQGNALKVEDAADLPLLKTIQRPKHVPYDLEGNLTSKPLTRDATSSYYAPQTLAELAALVDKHPQAYLLAGSTEFGLQVNKQFKHPDNIIYLGDVAELREIKDTGPTWKIGAMVDLLRVEALMREQVPEFGEVLRRFGSPPIRSTATLAGNIANGSPIGDSMPCLMALGAVLHLRAGQKARMAPLGAFYTGMKRSVLQAGEFIEAIEVPKPGKAVFRAHKVSKRFDQDISAVCCAMSYLLNEDGKFKQVRVAYNGVAPSPCRAPKIEAVIEGKAPHDVRTADVDAAIAESFAARDGLRATWTYRALVARNLVMQFVEEAPTRHESQEEAAV
jgi:xanthine dehydrogenase small subunit